MPQRMIVLGVTGSIGMGKTWAADVLRRFGIPVHDSDAEVHRLLSEDRAAIAAVESAFPGVTRNGEVDRGEMARRVFGDEAALSRLESILHPRVKATASRFLQRARRDRRPIVALDVPLLFETGGHMRCDAVIVVSAPRFVQIARVLHRTGMTPARLAAILARQTPDDLKQRLADFVVPTGLDRRTSLQALGRIITVARQRRCLGRPGTRRPRCHA
jgi:dephospho-CoA kinase